MSPNSTLRLLRINNKISQAEAAFKLGCGFMEINNIESEGYPVTGDIFLKLLSIYSTRIEDVIDMNEHQSKKHTV
jgi:transcriptional regulator with XRE-family HTH domain